MSGGYYFGSLSKFAFRLIEPMFVLESKREEKNQIMKLKAIGNVHFVYITSFTF